MSKAIILYYSYEGSTQKIAEKLAKNLSIDIEKVSPVKEIKTKGFGKYIWGGSQVVMKKRPKITPILSNLDEYDTVFIGSPIWAGTFTPPIYSLLESGALKDKNIAYFYCHKGGANKAVEKAKLSIEKHNSFISAYSCLSVEKNYDNIIKDITKWAKKILADYDNEPKD